MPHNLPLPFNYLWSYHACVDHIYACTIDKRVTGLETRDDVRSTQNSKINTESLQSLLQSNKALVYTLTGTVSCFSLLDMAPAWLETQNSGFWPVKGSKRNVDCIMRLFRQKLTGLHVSVSNPVNSFIYACMRSVDHLSLALFLVVCYRSQLVQFLQHVFFRREKGNKLIMWLLRREALERSEDQGCGKSIERSPGLRKLRRETRSVRLLSRNKGVRAPAQKACKSGTEQRHPCYPNSVDPQTPQTSRFVSN